jgi:hypothetical protein
MSPRDSAKLSGLIDWVLRGEYETWVNPKTWDIRGFNVYAATSPGGPYVRANQVLITGTDAYSVQGLQNDIQYYFVVRSKDWGDNESVNSAEVSATPHP